MRHLVIDGYNLIHRAKGGFQKGNWPIVFNFFRGLRPLIEKFLPVSSVWIVLEGQPKRHEAVLAEYKGNRPESTDAFKLQKDEIVGILRHLPVQVIYHQDYEADDVIYNVVSRLSENGYEVIVVSSDSDFTQLLQNDMRQHCSKLNVSVWNWRNNAFLETPEFNYVKWKALRGDATDNIPKCKGMSDAKALNAVQNDVVFQALLKNDELRADFERNMSLIELVTIDDDDWKSCAHSVGSCNFDVIKERFISYGFKSMTKDDTWDKWVSTFLSIGK